MSLERVEYEVYIRGDVSFSAGRKRVDVIHVEELLRDFPKHWTLQDRTDLGGNHL